jgi:hypothetical protein
MCASSHSPSSFTGNLSAINATFTGATTRTNLSASNGSIYTFSADTGEFVGLNTEMICSEEAEIERLVETNKISVMNLTPTLPEELTSNSYVDSQVGLSVKLNSVNTFTANQVINGDLKANNVVVQNTTPTLNTQLTSN